MRNMAFSIFALAAVASIAKAPNTLGPAKLGEGRIHYADQHDDYIYRFASDGTYNVVMVHKSGSDAKSTNGTYTYKRTGKRTATLKLDKDETWKLTWDKPNRARAKTEGDERTYIWFWESED